MSLVRNIDCNATLDSRLGVYVSSHGNLVLPLWRIPSYCCSASRSFAFLAFTRSLSTCNSSFLMSASRSLTSSVKRSFSFFSCSTSWPPLDPLIAPGEALRGVEAAAGAGTEVAGLGTTPPASATVGAGLTGVEAGLGASAEVVGVGAAELACRVWAGEAGTLDGAGVFLTGAEAAEDWSSRFCGRGVHQPSQAYKMGAALR